MSACKQCKNDKAREYRENNPDKQRQKKIGVHIKDKKKISLYARI